MKAIWICLTAALLTLSGMVKAQSGTAADFRSDVESSSDPVVQAQVTHSQNVDTVAFSAISAPAPYWGYGGRFAGGWVGISSEAVLPGTGVRTGVYAYGNGGASANYGLAGTASGPDGSGNYGVYGSASCVGSCSAYAVYASGDLAYTGSLIDASDLKLKEGLAAAESLMDKLMDLQVVTYQHRSDPELAPLNLPEGPQIGFIAQQVAEVFPELVVEAVQPPQESLAGNRKELAEPLRYQAIKPMQLIPILVKAIQEQQAQIEALTAKIAPLEKRLARMERNDGKTTVTALSP